MRMNNFKLIEGSSTDRIRCVYDMSIASLSMLEKLRGVKASLDEDVTKIYILENRVAPLYNVSEEELDEITGIYDRYIRQFLLDKTYAHITHIFRYWSMINTKRPVRLNTSSINSVRRLVDSSFNEPSYDSIIYNLLIELRHEDQWDGTCDVMPATLKSKLLNKYNHYMGKTKPSYENLNDIVNVAELLVRCCGTNPHRSISAETLHIDPMMRSYINDRSHLSLEAAVSTTPKTIYRGLSEGTFNDRSDSLNFALSAEFFYNNVPSFTKMNYNTMSFGTETDR